MVNQLRKAMLVVLAVAAVLTACAPAQGSTDANQGQVATSVAMTVQAQVGGIAAAVVSTLTAQAPAAMATLPPTQIPLNLPVTDTPLATVTPFVVTPASGSGGGGSGATTALYACSWYEVRPTINVFKPGDWQAGKDFKFASGTQMSSFTGLQLPAIKSGDTFNINFSATAPTKPGFYEMQFKVEGGLCFPALDIEVGKPKDP
jgi:hypothetical protein